MGARRVFNQEFKVESVMRNVICPWVREAKGDKTHALPGRGQMKPRDAELAHLGKESVMCFGSALSLNVPLQVLFLDGERNQMFEKPRKPFAFRRQAAPA